MLLDDLEIKQLTLDLMKTPTKRDGQRIIGPSSIGNPCDYCLAMSLVGTPSGSSPWWMGARIGTAIHTLMETEIAKHQNTPMEPKFEALRNAAVEESLFIARIEDYGDVYGKSDLALTSRNLIDWKTSTKEKIKKLKLDGVPQQYRVQQSLYALGWNQIEPGVIERWSLVFIARDGSGDNDVWVYSEDYDEQVAVDALFRLQAAWDYLYAGGDIEAVRSHEDCFVCQNLLRRW